MGKIGVIGGSAVYDIEGIKVIEKKTVDTPFGEASDEFIIGTLAGKEVVFLPRHGKAHGLLPSEINNRANIYAFKKLGVDRIISVAAVGSLKENIKPVDMLLVDQFVDRTNQARPATFFGEGIVAHVQFAEPICTQLREHIYDSNKIPGVTIHKRGTYVNMEGPAFSTKAESHLYRSWDVDVIGMTNMSEARLAREAGICYATIAMVTDYDCWHLGAEVHSVSVDLIIENLTKTVKTAKEMLKNAISNMPEERSCKCSEALKDAIITRKDAVPPETLEKLRPIIDGFI